MCTAKHRKWEFPNILPQTVNTHAVHIPVVTSSDNADNVRTNATLRRVRVATDAVKKQEVLRILSVYF